MSPYPRNRPVGVVVPVKRPGVAKSRMRQLGEDVRRRLATAFAQDTVDAALGSAEVAVVLVVTDEPELASTMRAAGAYSVPDRAENDLNQSLVAAAGELVSRWPCLRPAALCADLPALRAAELTRALQAAPDDRLAFVSDADGTGTTMVVAPRVEQFTPRYGPGSRDAHLAIGAVELELDVPGLRRDVDTPTDLAAAAALGLGAKASRIVARLRIADVQATVSSFDPQTFAGSVLLDDGVELPFTAEALAGSGLRLLRAGQRVRLEITGAGSRPHVERLQIVTLR